MIDASTFKNIILLTILILLIVYIFTLNIRTVKNNTQGLLNMENFNTEVDGMCGNIMKKKTLYTPTSVNIPFIDQDPSPESPIFNTLKNYANKKNMKFTGKYCFPIEKLMYDGIWDSNVVDINNSADEKQQRNWDLPNFKPMDGLYCGNQLLKLPEKNLKIGDEIITKDNCDKYYPPPSIVEEKVRACTKLHTDLCPTKFEEDGLIKTTNGKWKINAV